MKRTEALKLMYMAIVAYPDFDPTRAEAEIWMHSLGDVSLEYAATNLQQHISTSKFPPTVSDILYTKLKVPIDPERYRHNAEFVHHLWDIAENKRRQKFTYATGTQASMLLH